MKFEVGDMVYVDLVGPLFPDLILHVSKDKYTTFPLYDVISPIPIAIPKHTAEKHYILLTKAFRGELEDEI